MSLTHILDYSNPDFKDFRSLLSRSFPSPGLKCNEKIMVHPKTTNYGLVGGAFDYLLRFNLQRRYKAQVFTTGWVAEHALNYFSGGGVYVSPGEEVSGNYRAVKGWFEKRKARNKVILERYNKCEEIHKRFVNSGLVQTAILAESCLFLAKLDSVARAGPSLIERIDFLSNGKGDVDDLKQLIKHCDFDLFRPEKKLILNPTFGKGSTLVGGADADVILDGTLIDIKVTKEIRLARSHFNQIIGYYLLYLLGGITGHKDINITRLGIYFARYNFLWTVEVREIARKNAFANALDFLKKHRKLKRMGDFV